MISLKIPTEEDIPIIYEMCLKFIDESPYREYPRDEHKILSLIASFLSNQKERICILGISNGIPIGIIAGSLSQALFSQQQVASEVMWWVDPEHRGKTRAALELLGAFEHWAKLVGASFIQMQSLTNEYEIPLERFFTAKGYRPKEIAYVKELN